MTTEVTEDDSSKPWLKDNLVKDFGYLRLGNLLKMLEPHKYVFIAYERISKVGYLSLGYFLYQLDKEDFNSLCTLTMDATNELKQHNAGTKEYAECKSLQQVTLLVALLALGEGYGDADNDWTALRIKFYESITKILENIALGGKLDYRKISLFS